MGTDRTRRKSYTDQLLPHKRQIFSKHDCILLYQLCSNKKVAIALLACIGKSSFFFVYCVLIHQFMD